VIGERLLLTIFIQERFDFLVDETHGLVEPIEGTAIAVSVDPRGFGI
jgi:hypothetical protein